MFVLFTAYDRRQCEMVNLTQQVDIDLNIYSGFSQIHMCSGWGIPNKWDDEIKEGGAENAQF